MMHRLNHTHGGNISEVARRYGLRHEEIIDFSASINPLGISERARGAVINRFDSVLHYPEQFPSALTSLISDFHGISERCILPGNGSTELIYLIPRVFKPHRALIVIPTFSEYRNALELVECEADSFLLSADNGFELEWKRLTSILESGYDILYLCNPGNPTGALVSKNSVLEIVGEALKHGTICVVDEAFMDFAEDESVKREAVTLSNLIVLRSMTKFFAIPGMRVGFAVSNEDNINKMMVYKEPWSINALGCIAAIESLRDAPYIEDTKRTVAGERDYLYSELSRLSWFKPFLSAANYLLTRIEKDELDSDILFDRLAKEGLMIRSCASFEGLGSKFFRVAVRKREENERLIKSLKRI